MTINKSVHSMQVFNDPIPKHKMQQFHELMCSTDSKYISTPVEWKNYYRVDYEPTVEFVELWNRYNITITESRKDQWYRRLYRRILIILKLQARI